MRLEYFFDSAYAGFDRFGRVVDQRWYDYGASADRDRYTYGYDRASNRTYRENTIASAKDEFYTYDAINRLKTFDRGDLNAGKTAISGTPVREEDWGLDMTGNWKDYLQKTSGSTDLDQDRTHNKVNEISDITETTGTAWATPVHDRAGNMTSVPKPASLANSLTLKWDAWNRLVEAKDGATVIGVYEYDGLNRTGQAPRRQPSSGQSQRHRHVRPLLLQLRVAGARNAGHHHRERPAGKPAARLAVRLVAALHRRARAAGQEHGCRRAVRR